MAEAAKLLGLDPEDERHRALLLECVRAASKKRGRPKGSEHWNSRKLIDLGLDAERLDWEVIPEDRAARRLELSDAKLAKKIFDNVKGFQSIEVVRRHLPAARAWYEMWYEKHWMDGLPEALEGWNEDRGDDDDRGGDNK